jgi:hypothetical protein
MFFAFKRHFDAIFILSSRFFFYIYRRMKMQNMKILTSILFLLISFVGMAQTMPPPPQPPPPPGLPIDSGVLVVMVLGVFFGVYKLLKANKA